MSLSKGLAAEDAACQYLVKQGLTWVESNYRCKLGEIDLIMRDKEYWVFVEVRARTSRAYGSALETVTYSKQQKILKTASLYLTAHQLQEKARVRFDVISIEGTPPELTWISNAFGA
jgi:putative endonuclease